MKFEQLPVDSVFSCTCHNCTFWKISERHFVTIIVKDMEVDWTKYEWDGTDVKVINLDLVEIKAKSI